MKKLYKISDEKLEAEIIKDFSNANGTYKLFWYKKDRPRKINRLLDVDCDGILYIGKTDKTLSYRVGSLASAIKSNTKHDQVEPKEIGHKALAKKFFRIRKHIDINDLYVEVSKVFDTPLKDESRLLEKYIAEFGELPPMNGNYGSEADWSIY